MKCVKAKFYSQGIIYFMHNNDSGDIKIQSMDVYLITVQSTERKQEIYTFATID